MRSGVLHYLSFVPRSHRPRADRAEPRLLPGDAALPFRRPAGADPETPATPNSEPEVLTLPAIVAADLRRPAAAGHVAATLPFLAIAGSVVLAIVALVGAGFLRFAAPVNDLATAAGHNLASPQHANSQPGSAVPVPAPATSFASPQHANGQPGPAVPAPAASTSTTTSQPAPIAAAAGPQAPHPTAIDPAAKPQAAVAPAPPPALPTGAPSAPHPAALDPAAKSQAAVAPAPPPALPASPPPAKAASVSDTATKAAAPTDSNVAAPSPSATTAPLPERAATNSSPALHRPVHSRAERRHPHQRSVHRARAPEPQSRSARTGAERPDQAASFDRLMNQLTEPTSPRPAPDRSLTPPAAGSPDPFGSSAPPQ